MEDFDFVDKLRELLSMDYGHFKAVESQLYKSEEKYRSLLEQLTDAIYFTSKDGQFIEFNRATTDLLGYSYEELKKLRVENIYADPDDREKFKKIIEKSYEVKDYEVQLKKKNGEVIDCILTSNLRYSPTGKLVGYQGIIRDVTLRKKAESLQHAKELAEQAGKFKAEFLANMSHEIRTPLNAITGMLHLFQQTELSKKQKEYLRIIDTSSENLLEIINDILDFSRIEAGKLQLEQKYFSIRDVVQNLINTIQFKAEEKKLSLSLSIDEKIPAAVSGDPLRLNQILLNLVSNAIKFTQFGEIRVTVKLIDIIESKARIFFSVRDTGIGIEQDKLNSIFESFTQAATDTTRIYGGTGLGLAIVKKLIDMLNGAIMVKSRPGDGSEFIFELDFPVQKGAVPETKDEKDTDTSVDIGNCRILLAEDHPINQLVTSEMLVSKWKNAEVVIADNGKEVIEKLNHGHFDIILMDVQMPEMNGHDTTRYIRMRMEPPVSEIPILAFTAYATTGEAEKCIEAGMDDYISKPVKPGLLYKKIVELLAKKNYPFMALGLQEPDEQKPIDLNYFNKVTEEDRDLKMKMMRIMLDETPSEVSKLEKFCTDANWEGVRAIAHKMKSSMQFMGLDDGLEIIKSVELAAKEKTSLDLLPGKVRKVAAICDSAMLQLKTELDKMG